MQKCLPTIFSKNLMQIFIIPMLREATRKKISIIFFWKKIVGRHFCIGFAPLFTRSSSPLHPESHPFDVYCYPHPHGGPLSTLHHLHNNDQCLQFWWCKSFNILTIICWGPFLSSAVTVGLMLMWMILTNLYEWLAHLCASALI